MQYVVSQQHFNNEQNHSIERLDEGSNDLPRTESLTIPTDTRAAFAWIMKSWTVSGLSDEHPGGTTGRES